VIGVTRRPGGADRSIVPNGGRGWARDGGAGSAVVDEGELGVAWEGEFAVLLSVVQ